MRRGCNKWHVMKLLIFFVCSQLALSEPALRGSTTPVDRANLTLRGLFEYYWQSDPLEKDIQFFFACGQIGGGGSPYKWNKCSCYVPASCVNCYRWWDAVALESIASFGIYTGTKQYADTANIISSHSPYNSKWDAQTTEYCTFIDDFIWYGISYLRVYEWLKDSVWLKQAVALYNWTWKNGWDFDCGGVWWNMCDTMRYKDSITIVETLHLSSKLAYLFPKNIGYLHKAEKIWNWFYSFDNGQGLITDEGLVSTGAVPERCCNSSTTDPYSKCYNSKIPGTSYNQGLLISSAAYLYNATANKTYLIAGLKAIEAIIVNYTTSEGILIDEPRNYPTYQNDVCWGGTSDPGGDWYSFQGIFMLHLSYFVEVLGDNNNVPDDTLVKIKALIQNTSDAAWSRSAVWPPFHLNDACNTAPKRVKYKTQLPKFHWWWGTNGTIQVVTPSPRIFFHKLQLRCNTSNNSQLWQGMTDDEGTCTVKCQKNKNCSKYLFETDQVAVQNLNCWLWSYNRSDHSCHLNDSDFNVGIKRPIGASCAGHCGSSIPIKTATGGVCYCDSNCAKHLDCCLDYADQCLHKVPSCKGFCGSTLAHPIKGGGYCWCMNGCVLDIDGSCCPDYFEICQDVITPTCLDARSQGSALNLFLAHLKISQLKRLV